MQKIKQTFMQPNKYQSHTALLLKEVSTDLWHRTYVEPDERVKKIQVKNQSKTYRRGLNTGKDYK